MKLVLKISLVLLFVGELMSSSLPRYYEKKLSNGFKIIVVPMENNTGVISTNIFYDVGSRDETMGKSGIAHMLEHLNFKSTKNLKAGEFDTIVKSFGGVNNASTSFDYTQYFINSSTKNLDKSLELFAELQANLKLDEKEFQSERDVVLQERLWRTDNSPMGFLYFKLFNNSFTYHPYHWTPIGFMEDIKNWSLQDIKQFHQKHYMPSNSILVVAGDINKDVVFEKAEKYFNNIKNSTEKIDRQIHTKEPKQNGEKNIIIKKSTQTQMFAMGYHIPNFKHDDQVALSALSELLSSGKSSLLHETLIDKKQLLTSIYAYNMELKDPGLFLFVGNCNDKEDPKVAIKEIKKIIKNIKLGKINNQMLEKIKLNTKKDFVFSLESSSSIASLYGSYLIRGDIKPLFEYEEAVEKLTLKDIQDVAKRYLTNSNLTTIVLKDIKSSSKN